jgi:riboflavin synthase
VERVFTGLVEATGRLRRRTPRGTGFRIEIATDLGPLTLGESIAVNGACLTVVSAEGGGFEADVSIETNERTSLGAVAPGDLVNLERSLAVGDRLGGHFVAGHVDGIAVVSSIVRESDALRVGVEAPADLSRFIAEKGSVTLDGVSLTVNRVRGTGFEVMLIPHTVSVTTLKSLAVGRKLNLEVDLLARYVVRYLEKSAESGTSGGLEGALRRAGILR